MKTCCNSKCTKENPQSLIEFGVDRHRKDGLNPVCKSCNKRYRDEHKEEKAISDAKYTAAHKKEKATYDAIYRMKNKEKVDNYEKARRKEKSIYNALYARANPGKMNARTAKRMAAKLQATPMWLTKQQIEEIEAFYVEAARLTKETRIKHHVDHIIPLQGKNVTGLHVPWNLQILTASQNASKGNRLL